jgi:hypothetical protein
MLRLYGGTRTCDTRDPGIEIFIRRFISIRNSRQMADAGARFMGSLNRRRVVTIVPASVTDASTTRSASSWVTNPDELRIGTPTVTSHLTLRGGSIARKPHQVSASIQPPTSPSPGSGLMIRHFSPMAQCIPRYVMCVVFNVVGNLNRVVRRAFLASGADIALLLRADVHR